MIPQLMDIKECSELLKISIGTLRHWCSQKKIPYLKLHGRCLFDPREIDRWLEKLKIQEKDFFDNYSNYKHSLTNRKIRKKYNHKSFQLNTL